MRALEVTTGRVVWEFPLHSPPWTGLLATAGDLVLGGTNEGSVFALEARTGRPLWHFQTGGGVHASPITYAVDGKQYVAIAAGRAIYSPRCRDRAQVTRARTSRIRTGRRSAGLRLSRR